MIPPHFDRFVYALLRVVVSFLYLVHGLQKTFGLFGGTAVPMTSMFGVAGVIETVAGVLILLGLWTRLAAFLASGQMAAAYFIVHLPRAFWPVENGGELAALFCFVFLYIATRGAGIWSLDALRGASAGAGAGTPR
jgi:putative oxidoreductase